MRKIIILRDVNGYKKNQIITTNEEEAIYLLSNGYAKKYKENRFNYKDTMLRKYNMKG